MAEHARATLRIVTKGEFSPRESKLLKNLIVYVALAIGINVMASVLAHWPTPNMPWVLAVGATALLLSLPVPMLGTMLSVIAFAFVRGFRPSPAEFLAEASVLGGVLWAVEKWHIARILFDEKRAISVP